MSYREWVEAPQLTRSADVVGEVLHPDFGLGPHQTDGFHYGAAHVIRLRAKDMLDHCTAVHAIACTRGPDANR